MSDKPPTFNLPFIERLRDRLADTFAACQGRQISPSDLETLVATATATLPRARADAVFESMRHIVGLRLAQADCITLAWRLAGNLPSLRAGIPVRIWVVQRANEWAPMQILEALPARNHKGRPGYNYILRFLAGTACPMAIQHFWSDSAARTIARELGLSAPWGHYPFRRALDLIGLRFTGYVEAERSSQGPYFFRISCPASLVKWNKDNVLKLRYRINRTCPEGFQHPCFRCAVGYLECPAGCHRQTYVLQHCDACGTEAYFDPGRNAVHCVSCDNKERRRVVPA